MFQHSPVHLPVGLNLDEDFCENKDLKEFYEINLSHLFTCSMISIDYDIKRKIGVMLFSTMSCPSEWRKYATEMGMHNETMNEIEAGAFCHRELPIFFALDKRVQTFGNVIQALLNTERFDVLSSIKTYVQSLLSKLSHRQTSNSSSSMTCKSENEQRCELNSFQHKSINLKKGLNISDSSTFAEKSLEEIKIPTAPEEGKITALIQHAESENTIADHLVQEFSKEGVLATTLTEVNNYAQYASERVLDTVFNEVDFIVPIVSESFMEEINPENNDQYQESLHVQNNYYLYNLCMTEYKKNRCVNFRVRPVIVPEMSRRLISNPILLYSFRLDKEIPKLIKVLKETQDLNAQHLVK